MAMMKGADDAPRDSVRRFARVGRLARVAAVALLVAPALAGCLGRGKAAPLPHALHAVIGGVEVPVLPLVRSLPSTLPRLTRSVLVVAYSVHQSSLIGGVADHSFTSSNVPQPLTVLWLRQGKVVAVARVARCAVSCSTYQAPKETDAEVLAAAPLLQDVPVGSSAVFR